MGKNQRKNAKDYSALSKRFVAAYKNIPPSKQQGFREDFGKEHKLAEETVRQRCYGYLDVTEWECRWIEGYDPYTRVSTPVITAKA